jgi:hypothetical protein
VSHTAHAQYAGTQAGKHTPTTGWRSSQLLCNISITTAIMDIASLRRKDLMKNFPSSYTSSGLTLHFRKPFQCLTEKGK